MTIHLQASFSSTLNFCGFGRLSYCWIVKVTSWYNKREENSFNHDKFDELQDNCSFKSINQEVNLLCVQ